MKPLIHLSHLVPMLALLTWGSTLSLVVFLDNMLHLLQPRTSVADEFVASIFGDPLPGMASSSHALPHTTMPPFFDSSIYTGPGTHWTAPNDYFPSGDQ
jgi:hypothetical protein